MVEADGFLFGIAVVFSDAADDVCVRNFVNCGAVEVDASFFDIAVVFPGAAEDAFVSNVNCGAVEVVV